MGRSRILVEPIPNEPAARIYCGDELAVAIADYHAGIEAGLRYERGVELESNADRRLDRVCSLLERTGADRLIVLGDLGHRIGEPTGAEKEELDTFFDTVLERVSLTLAVGNHDGGLVAEYDSRPGVTIIDSAGGLVGDRSVGVLHGHTWPDPSLSKAEIICMGHEHPSVQLQDTVGGTRVEKVWLRGTFDRTTLFDNPKGACGADQAITAFGSVELVVFPVFNERSGGTWINVEGQAFLSPFLPDALSEGHAYLLDGTRLGAYQQV